MSKDSLEVGIGRRKDTGELEVVLSFMRGDKTLSQTQLSPAAAIFAGKSLVTAGRALEAIEADAAKVAAAAIATAQAPTPTEEQ